MSDLDIMCIGIALFILTGLGLCLLLLYDKGYDGDEE